MNNNQRDDDPAPDNYRPTKGEAEAAQRMVARRAKSPPSPRFKVTYANAKPAIEPEHQDKTCAHVLLADLLATGDSVLTEGMLIQLANVAQAGERLTAIDLNMMVATVKAIKPRDETETLLACQMAAMHAATMRMVRRMNRSETLPQQDSAGSLANKLARTFAAQLEALKRYRSNGEQSIKVQHVTVNEGGQAIVGNVAPGGGAEQKREHQPHGPSETGAPSPPLLSDSQAFPPTMPCSGGDGLERVSMSRGKGRCPRG